MDTITIDFQPLDLSYEIQGRTPVIIIWAKNRHGSNIVLIDKRFRPYFYVLPIQDEKAIRVLKNRIMGASIPRSPIIQVIDEEKKYFGRKVNVLKIVTVIPDAVREYREKIKTFPEVQEVLEADVRYAMRYMIDNDIKPFRWYRAKVIETTASGYRTGVIYEIIEDPIELDDDVSPPKLSLIAFDIEVYNPTGTPRATKDPIIIIGALNSGFHQFIAKEYNDTDVIKNFKQLILDLDPDIITGYNINRFDWPYLLERARILNIKLDVTRRVGVEPSPSVHGHISVPGRLNVDIYDFAEEVYEVKRKTLEEIAEYFGVMKREERVLLEWYDIPKYWDLGGEARRKLLIYNKHDVISVFKLAEKFLPFGIQLSSLTGIPLDQVMAASVGFRLEFYLMRKAYKHNELVPNRGERPPETYRGAIVLKPKPGVHNNIAVLDFTSMYPNIMIKYNVGPDTLVREESMEDVYIAPDVGHRFRKDPPGFFKSILQDLVKARKKIREQLKNMQPNTPEYNVLNERQKAMKVLANAAYGYMGWQAARWYCKECAEAVTAWGRHTISKAVEKARELRLSIIYGDTDSLFVENDEDKIKTFIEWVEKELGFDIKIDKLYKRVFFTEAKKRYIGVTTEGIIDIVGFEAIRGDWSEIAKEVQTEVAKLVLEEGKPDKAIEYVRNLIQAIKDHTIPLQKLVIWKTLTKKIEEYEVEAPHVRAAKKYIEEGIKVSPGDKIGYIIVKGPGKISEKAQPYFLVKEQDIDENYYIEHQIIPAALRILNYFGVNEKTLKLATVTKQKSLFDFLGK